jgi:hypothetical protein
MAAALTSHAAQAARPSAACVAVTPGAPKCSTTAPKATVNAA